MSAIKFTSDQFGNACERRDQLIRQTLRCGKVRTARNTPVRYRAGWGPKLAPMSVLAVEAVGLQSLAGVCTLKSAAVAAASATAAPATSFQPSAAAVSAIHTEAGLAGARLSGRLTATATHLTSAAAGYTDHEANSAAVLADLAVTV